MVLCSKTFRLLASFINLYPTVTFSLIHSRLGIKHVRSMATFRSNAKNLEQFGLTNDNSVYSWLIEKDEPNLNHIPESKQIFGAHFVQARPEPVRNPYLVTVSASCLQDIGLDSSELKKESFLNIFSGNSLAPGLDEPYATVYGCNCYGNWFGQLGNLCI